MWSKDININQVVEIRSKSTIYLGVGAIKKIEEISKKLKDLGISKVVVVTGKKSYIKTGAWDYCKKAFEENDIKYTIYDKVTPNPEVDHVDEATQQAIDFKAQAVISIGGGSPIDAAKSVAVLMKYPDKNARDLYEYKFNPEKAVPIVAVNLTHGTGTEIDRFAVVTIPEKKYKPYIAVDCVYPMFSIDDPALMVTLPKEQTLYVSIDAINHVVEASTSKAASPYSILLGKEAIRLVAKYLPIAIDDSKNLEARYYLTYASMIAGISFDNGLLHFTHALEHPLSAVQTELTHGLGLSLLLPSVLKETYKERGATLADLLEPIVPNLTGHPDESEKVFEGVKTWLSDLGVNMGLANNGFTKDQIDELTELVFITPGLEGLIQLAPGQGNKDVVKEIYNNSL
ncbi:MAG: iron-containing alcohol dehydrogenase [Clostridiales bacterium]